MSIGFIFSREGVDDNSVDKTPFLCWSYLLGRKCISCSVLMHPVQDALWETTLCSRWKVEDSLSVESVIKENSSSSRRNGFEDNITSQLIHLHVKLLIGLWPLTLLSCQSEGKAVLPMYLIAPHVLLQRWDFFDTCAASRKTSTATSIGPVQV